MEPKRPGQGPVSPTEIALRTGLCAPGLDVLQEGVQLNPDSTGTRRPLERSQAIVPQETGRDSPFPIY